MARGLVDPAAMKSALQASLAGRGLTEVLVERGDLSEDDLARALAEHHRLDHVDLDLFDVDAAASALVAPDLARRLGAVGIAFARGGALVVAVHDPTGSPAVRELAGLTDRPIQQAIVSRAQLAAAIGSLQRPASGAPQVAENPHCADVHAADLRPVRSVPVASMHPADLLRPSAPPSPPVVPMASRAESDECLRTAEQRALSAEQRALSAEQHVQSTEQQVRELRDGARTAEQRAKTAEASVGAANARAEGLMAAAVAANEALARLVGNCELLEREAEAREGELQALRSELDLERTERAQLQTRLLETLPDDELIALNVRAAELERELAEAHSATPSGQVAGDAPAAAQPAAYVAPPPEPAIEIEVPHASVTPVQAPAIFEPVADDPVASYAPTIDIPGTPGVPYVRALAPMPPVAEPRRPTKSAKDEAKAKGLRRLIGALRRG